MKNSQLSIFEVYDKEGKLIDKIITVSQTPGKAPKEIKYSEMPVEQKRQVEAALSLIETL